MDSVTTAAVFHNYSRIVVDIVTIETGFLLGHHIESPSAVVQCLRPKYRGP
jgi:hypothetical protein